MNTWNNVTAVKFEIAQTRNGCHDYSSVNRIITKPSVNPHIHSLKTKDSDWYQWNLHVWIYVISFFGSYFWNSQTVQFVKLNNSRFLEFSLGMNFWSLIFRFLNSLLTRFGYQNLLHVWMEVSSLAASFFLTSLEAHQTFSANLKNIGSYGYRDL